MANIWITGTRGFIGRYLALWLKKQGHKVTGIGHGTWSAIDAKHWGVSYWLEGEINITNLRSLQYATTVPDIIYHLAGGASVSVAINAPLKDFFRTVASTAELLEWMRIDAPTACLIAVSSAAVYGSGHQGSISEDTHLHPYSPYGYHKLLMEQLCRSYSASYGLHSVVARLFSVYGNNLRKQLLWDICNRLSAGETTIVLGGSGDELRDWTDVRDVVRALALLPSITTPEALAVNVGSGLATSVHDVASLVLNAWESPNKHKLCFSQQARLGDPFSLVANSKRLSDIGFAWEVPIAQGIEDYVKWFKSQRDDII